MCCRLQLDLKELKKRGNGLFGSAEQTGSIGVVTLNLAQIGYRTSSDKDKLFNLIEHYATLAKDSLELKRAFLNEQLERGLYPYTKRYVGTYRNFFSTIGINGLNECIRNFKPEWDITSSKGRQLGLDILDHLRNLLVKFQEETGHLYNLEATPAEGTTYRFAKEDQKRYPYIIQAGTDEAPYYTNSSQLPVGYTEDMFEALSLQEEFQRKYTGGTVFHGYVGEEIGSAEACAKLVKNVLSSFRIPYFTVTPTFSICPTHGHIKGEHHTCPECKQTTEVWTRVMGYHRPMQSFNKGKKSEFAERVYFI
jgi:ribonucleoside-triphosphate reductase